MTQDSDWMRYALSLGQRGAGRTWPNPAVGCVIVKNDQVVGRGWTQPGGRPHAETQALAQAKNNATGATAYVTLEPCAHHGRTPPCAQALIDASVGRVVAPFDDRDPRVAGKGFAMLRDAGIEVTTGVQATSAARAHEGFFLRTRMGRPTLTLKLALSLDGRIATASGESKWITGPAARRAVHAMRLRHDAVLIGGGTARADDPLLTVRGFGQIHQPVRIAASRRLALDANSTLIRTAKDTPVWLLHGREAPNAARNAVSAAGVKLIETPSDGTSLSPDGMLHALGAQGLTSVFCEGGGALAASLLHADLVDTLAVFHAGLAIGAEGTPGLGAMGLDRLAHAPRFELDDVAQVGTDTLALWRRAGSVI